MGGEPGLWAPWGCLDASYSYSLRFRSRATEPQRPLSPKSGTHVPSLTCRQRPDSGRTGGVGRSGDRHGEGAWGRRQGQGTAQGDRRAPALQGRSQDVFPRAWDVQTKSSTAFQEERAGVWVNSEWPVCRGDPRGQGGEPLLCGTARGQAAQRTPAIGTPMTQGEGSGCHLSFLPKAAEKHVLCVKPAHLPPLSPAEVWPGGS